MEPSETISIWPLRSIVQFSFFAYVFTRAFLASKSLGIFLPAIIENSPSCGVRTKFLFSPFGRYLRASPSMTQGFFVFHINLQKLDDFSPRPLPKTTASARIFWVSLKCLFVRKSPCNGKVIRFGEKEAEISAAFLGAAI